MRVLLIYPRFSNTQYGREGERLREILGTRATMPPLGLLTVAALCPADWEFRMCDMTVRDLMEDDLECADLAMISGMMPQHEAMLEVLKRCKARGLRTVVGGPHATSSPDLLPDADHLILDEGEITLPPFLADLAAGN